VIYLDGNKSAACYARQNLLAHLPITATAIIGAFAGAVIRYSMFLLAESLISFLAWRLICFIWR